MNKHNICSEITNQPQLVKLHKAWRILSSEEPRLGQSGEGWSVRMGTIISRGLVIKNWVTLDGWSQGLCTCGGGWIIHSQSGCYAIIIKYSSPSACLNMDGDALYCPHQPLGPPLSPCSGSPDLISTSSAGGIMGTVWWLPFNQHQTLETSSQVSWSLLPTRRPYLHPRMDFRPQQQRWPCFLCDTGATTFPTGTQVGLRWEQATWRCTK